MSPSSESTAPAPVTALTIADRFAATVRRAAEEPPSTARDVRAALLMPFEGRICALRLETLADASPEVSIPAAGILALLEHYDECFTVLRRLAPTQHDEILAIALRVLPRLPPPVLSAHRAWIVQLITALLRSGLATRFPSFVRALHSRGHFELVDAIRSSAAGTYLRPDDELLLDATEACWAGRSHDARQLLAARPLIGDAARLEADLLSAIARGARDPAGETVAALDTVRATPGCPAALSDTAGRWKAELLVRRETGRTAGPDRAGATAPHRIRRLLSSLLRGNRGRRAAADAETTRALREASDHAALRLVHWIDLLRQPDDGRREAIRDFHEWVIDRLCAERVAGIEPLAAEWRTRHEESTLWKIIALFGGNRTDTCTVVENGRLRAVDVRTARQEAVAVQARLRRAGFDATLRELDALSTRWPALTVFRTYKAELLLWVGRYDEAAVIFDQIRRCSSNRWAHVGLGAALAAMGQDADAERVWNEGRRVHRGALPGEATFVYRAEVAMRRGDLARAAQLLRGVLAAKPTRLRGWIELAEIAWTRGECSEGRAALLQASALCPGLLYANSIEPLTLDDLLRDDAGTGRRDAAITFCRSLRVAMRGNASSWLFTWFDQAGELHAYGHMSAPDLLLGLQRLERIGVA